MSTSTSRWLTWTAPKTAEIIEKGPEPEPSKPSKPGFGGFGGSSLRTFPIIEATETVPLPVTCTCSENPFPHFQHHDGTGPSGPQQRREKLGKLRPPGWRGRCT